MGGRLTAPVITYVMHVEGLVGHSQVPVGGRLTATVITYIMHVESLVGHSQVPVGGRLTAPVIHLLADGQLLLVVLDGLGHTRNK